jgi:hypothetical protein
VHQWQGRFGHEGKPARAASRFERRHRTVSPESDDADGHERGERNQREREDRARWPPRGVALAECPDPADATPRKAVVCEAAAEVEKKAEQLPAPEASTPPDPQAGDQPTPTRQP